MRSGLIGWAKRTAKRPAVLYVLLALVLILLAVHNIGSVPRGMDVSELAAKNSSQSLSVIKNNPINAPHSLLAYGYRHLGQSWLSSLRLSSLTFALFFIWGITYVLRAWFGKWIGLMGALLFISTPLFLVLARHGSAAIMYFSLAAVMAVYISMLRAKNKDFALIFLVILCALFIYTPGIALWLAGAAIIARKKITDTLQMASPLAISASILLGVLLLIPLLFALVSDWHLIRQLVPLPSHFARPLTILKEIVWMALALLIKAPYHSDIIIGRLPVLNIVQDALLVFGVYALWNAAKSKLLALLSGVIFSVILAGINNELALLALAVIPIAVFVCAGVRYLYIEWLGVFPINPVARGLALTLLWAAVIIQLLFGIRYSVIAWPVTSDTKATFVLK